MTPEQMKRAAQEDEGGRDWPEDFLHENGMYSCVCCYCKTFFCGYKRRVVCKLCAEPAASRKDAAIRAMKKECGK